MVQFYPFDDFAPLTDGCENVELSAEIQAQLTEFVKADIEEIKKWPTEDQEDLKTRIQSMKTEQGRAEIEAEFYKRFEAADANCNNRLSIEEWFEFTEGYKVGREQRREKFVEKEDDELEKFW